MDFLGFDLQIACLFEEEDVNLFAYLWIFLDFACLFAWIYGFKRFKIWI